MSPQAYYYEIDISADGVVVYRVYDNGQREECTAEGACTALASEASNRTYLNTRAPNGQRILMKVSKKWTDETGITWAAGELIVNGASTKTEKELFDLKGWIAI